MFYDRQMGELVANQSDKEGKLKPQDGVFVGRAPNDFVGANTSLTWAGVYWTVVMWPLPAETPERARLILHECWHRIQEQIGLPGAMPNNDHLDTRNGRIWLQLEFRALARALPAWGAERKQGIEDALAFRAYRRQLFPDAAKNEDRMEVHEGLAEYTGVRAAFGQYDGRYYMAGRLKLGEVRASFAYGFAYDTGPAYGLLLDMQEADWRNGLTTSSSLSALLAEKTKIDPGHPSLQAVLERAKRYEGDRLIASENLREQKRLAQEKRNLQDFVTGPVLRLPLGHPNYSFDPNAVTPLPGHGKVYTSCKFADDWGVLEVDGSAFVPNDFSSVVVPAPGEGGLKGKGWTLQLNSGWKLVPGARKGDYTLARS